MTAVCRVDVVADLVAIDAQAEGGASSELAQGQLGVMCGFFVQIRIAQFDGARRRMRPVGIQFLGGRQALRTRQREAQRVLRRKGSDRASGNRGATVTGIGLVTVDVDALPLVTQSQLIAPVVQAVFLKQEQCVITG